MNSREKRHKSLIVNTSFVRVLYRDTDQMGYVYYANYLVWFEHGRGELMRSIGHPYTEVEREGIFLPVTRCSCRYRSPARYDDLLRIETSITEIAEVSITFTYKLFRDETDELLATGETKHAFVDREGGIARFGPTLKKYLRCS